MISDDDTYSTDVLVIGAGAAGLLAAWELAAAGRRVLLVEARDRVGGRVHTVQPAGFTQPIEAGAEFMHGDVPLTKSLLQQAGIAWEATAGRTYQLQHGQVQSDAHYFAQLPQLLEKLAELAADMPPAAHSSRPVGGYGPLLRWLAGQAQAAGAVVHLATPVEAIAWQPGSVHVRAASGAVYHARQVLCTVPLGVWQLAAGEPGYLRFEPELATHRATAAQLGFGAVIKVVLEFQSPFWHGRLPELEFLLSDAPVPTWWSQLPAATPQLTGWLAGPAAHRLRHAPAETVLQQALESLSYLLAKPLPDLQAQLVGHYVHNWGSEPYAHGAYSYPTVGGAAARAALAASVADTLFFAGEGVYEGLAAGTVEAALVSGQAAARALLAQGPR